jgi:hypothetical protein
MPPGTKSEAKRSTAATTSRAPNDNDDDSEGKLDTSNDASNQRQQPPSSLLSDLPIDLTDAPSLQFPLPRIHAPDIIYFDTKHFRAQQPVIITGLLDHWPAMGANGPQRSWNNLDYLKQIAGRRTVPVEMGSNYTAEDWGQQLMTLTRFIDEHIIPTLPDNHPSRQSIASHSSTYSSSVSTTSVSTSSTTSPTSNGNGHSNGASNSSTTSVSALFSSLPAPTAPFRPPTPDPDNGNDANTATLSSASGDNNVAGGRAPPMPSLFHSPNRIKMNLPNPRKQLPTHSSLTQLLGSLSAGSSSASSTTTSTGSSPPSSHSSSKSKSRGKKKKGSKDNSNNGASPTTVTKDSDALDETDDVDQSTAISATPAPETKSTNTAKKRSARDDEDNESEPVASTNPSRSMSAGVASLFAALPAPTPSSISSMLPATPVTSTTTSSSGGIPSASVVSTTPKDEDRVARAFRRKKQRDQRQLERMAREVSRETKFATPPVGHEMTSSMTTSSSSSSSLFGGSSYVDPLSTETKVAPSSLFSSLPAPKPREPNDSLVIATSSSGVVPSKRKLPAPFTATTPSPLFSLMNLPFQQLPATASSSSSTSAASSFLGEAPPLPASFSTSLSSSMISLSAPPSAVPGRPAWVSSATTSSSSSSLSSNSNSSSTTSTIPSSSATLNSSAPPHPREASPSSSAPAKRVGYLAQHQLFDQVPVLRQDIAVPGISPSPLLHCFGSVICGC